MILIYNILLLIVIIIFLPVIIPILILSEKRRRTLLPRLGITRLLTGFNRKDLTEIDQPVIWIHALSVGEVLSSVPLLDELIKRLDRDIPNNRIVFSVSTATGYDIACKVLQKKVSTIFFFPYDLYFSVNFVTKKINPAIVVIIESDIWPNFLFIMKNRNIPVILANARLSDKSLKGYQHFPWIFKKILTYFTKICAQSGQDAARYLTIGVPPEKLTITGNIKFDQTNVVFSQTAADQLKKSIGIQPGYKIFLAGSTHQGEESLILEAFKKLKKHFRNIVLIIAPRDPKRAKSICNLYKSSGHRTIQLKDIPKANSNQQSDVIIIDIIGILKKLYSIADAAFIGGSLVKKGGHNPLEPAAYSKPVIYGPDMSNFAEISELLIDAQAAIQIFDPTELYKTVLSLFEDEKKAVRIGNKAYEIFCSNKGAVTKTVNEIINCLESDSLASI